MIYIEANITTTIPNTTSNMYNNTFNANSIASSANSNTSGNTNNNQQQPFPNLSDYPYQHSTQHSQLPPPPLPPPLATSLQQSSGNSYPSSKFTPQDIQILRQLLVAGEKYKWKQITKEINEEALNRRNEKNEEQTNSKNVSPTFVIKQYQSLLGLPSNSLYFGAVGSSLPYIVANNGWDDISDVQTHFRNEVD